MTSTRITFLIVLSLLILSACNMPLRGSTEKLPTVRVDVATDYRAGPGDAYERIGTMQPDDEFDVLGRSEDGGYLLVSDPADPALAGWMKSDGAKLSGSSSGLPIFIAPSVPTPVGLPGETGGCPTPVGGGPTPVSCPTPVEGAPDSSGCPTPVGGGPTPVSCPTPVEGAPALSGCPTPVGGGPTPVSCGATVPPTAPPTAPPTRPATKPPTVPPTAPPTAPPTGPG